MGLSGGPSFSNIVFFFSCVEGGQFFSAQDDDEHFSPTPQAKIVLFFVAFLGVAVIR